MIVYTAEDFAQAMFAVHPDPAAVDARYAARMNRDPEYPWLLDGVPGNGDEHMARDGWVPVVEATEVMQNRQIDAEAHLDQIEGLSKRLAAAGDQIESQRLVLEDLREENYRLKRGLQTPLTLESLAAAYEAAEQADECREGDVLIIRDDEDNYLVRRMDNRSDLDSTARILSRAPREPWVELAGVLHDVINQGGNDHIDVDSTAARLYAEGVRVTGGGDDE